MIKVCLAQIKPALGNMEKNMKIHTEFIEKAIESKNDVVVFPELSTSGYFLRDLVGETGLNEDSEIISKFKEMSKFISIIVGGVYEDRDYLLYNAAFYFEDGDLKHIHKKVYLPDYTMFEEGRYFAAGNCLKTFKTKYLNVGLLICEDALQVSSVYAMKLQKADIIYVISNSPARGLEKEKFYSQDFWYTALKYMALSCNAYVVFVNRVGVEEGVTFWGGSVVFSPMGEKVKECKLFDEEVAFCRFDKDEIKRARLISPFLKDDKTEIIKKIIDKKQGDI